MYTSYLKWKSETYTKNGNLSKKNNTHFLDLTLGEDCATRNPPSALKRREQMKEQTQGHYWRRHELKPRHVRIIKTMLRENTLLGL